ncbi:DEAD-domain-containing protein [Pholiota conissans]|uniref:ATP-dependent RNA helicase n=1 Tax=Pholiota conissans TaxID=109636 RepID=A0A9P5Z3M3_9AGAR|nr:DEAD-domain-containing protein [Pholiota conissans]
MMKQTTARPPRRRAPYASANPMSSAAGGSVNTARRPGPPPAAPAPSLQAEAKAPLTIPVPKDSMRFIELAKGNLLNPVLLQTITEDLKFDHMMPVQSATLHDLLEKRIDCLAQAKTGTGKTIAFLLPAIQTLLNKKRRPGSAISLLVISPTRELAMQIAKEASQLLQRLPQYKVCPAIGGTNKNSEERAILSGCDILIGTPGRLYDHLANDQVRGLFGNLDTLVLDEADRLLDMGFMNSLKEIIACLPDKATSRRQGMLFSATIAPHVQKFAHLVLANGYKFISTIPEGESNTHEHVPQLLVTVPTFADVASALVTALRAECATTGANKFKAIVFAPTAALADWYTLVLAGLAQSSPGLPPISALHSRMSQSKRTNITDAFRTSTASILIATDVIARGMDFPGVSTVIQVGVPSDRESYIHRLGRTARAGAEGRAVLILAQPEMFFPQRLLKEVEFQSYRPATPGGTEAGAGIASTATASAVRRAAEAMEESVKSRTYQAWLGYYKSHARTMRWSDEDLVAQANTFAAEGLGWSGSVPPPLQRQTVGKMGLKGVRGLNVVANEPRLGNPGRGGGGNSGQRAEGGAFGGGEGRPQGSGGRPSGNGGRPAGNGGRGRGGR